MERWTVVVNPTAGRGRARRLLPRLSLTIDALDADVTLHVATDPDDARRAAAAAFANERGVAACGGDGTVAALAGVAADAGGTLAVVPAGAGNDFARHLGLAPRRPLDALALLGRGRGTVVPCDLGRIHASDGSTRWFTTVANAGFDAEANRWANGVRLVGGTPLYVLAMLRTLMVYRPRPMRIRVDGHEWSGNAWLAAVGNTASYAGGMRITPGARADDGLLDVCVVGSVAITTLLTRFPLSYRGAHVGVRGVHTFRGGHVEIEAPDERRPLDLWASGEPAGPLPATLEAVPGALRVLVPKRDGADGVEQPR